MGAAAVAGAANVECAKSVRAYRRVARLVNILNECMVKDRSFE